MNGVVDSTTRGFDHEEIGIWHGQLENAWKVRSFESQIQIETDLGVAQNWGSYRTAIFSFYFLTFFSLEVR